MKFSLIYTFIFLSLVPRHVLSSICVNKQTECDHWAAFGECLRNPRYMYENCIKSCGACDEETNTTVDTATNTKIRFLEESENTLCEEGVCTIVLDLQVNDPCRDTSPDSCVLWANSGECKANPNFMHKSCAKSCGLCTPLTKSGIDAAAKTTLKCQDNDPKGECEEHVSNGDCYFDFPTMKKKCAASCLICVNQFDMTEAGTSDEEISRRINYTKMNLGTTQLIKGRDTGEKYHSKHQIVGMEVYAKTTAASSDLSENARSLCYNQLEDCAYLASKGLCQSRSIFMLSNCPLACMMCEELDQFHRCVGKTHPFDVPSFVQPDEVDEDSKDAHDIRTLQSFFDRLSYINGSMSVTDPSEPALFILEDLIVEPVIQEALSLIQESNLWQESTASKSDHFDGKSFTQIPIHKSKRLFCSNPSSSCYNITSSFLNTISSTLGIPTKYFSPPEYLRYQSGDYYTSHREYRIHDDWKPAGPRIISIYIPLTDQFDGNISGGSIGFPRLSWTILTPKKGALVIWPNVDENLVPIASMESEILPITSGEHYFFLTHIHLHEYERNVALRCA